MNKTVSINLAGIFFHIDEDAYIKLQRYLEAIKSSFTDSQGRSEIIADIESRIAELFNERIKNNKQVISNIEVDDVISIMGQPEDYLVDDDIFEDDSFRQNKQKMSSTKKLFRDTDSSYVGGIAAGLSHYLGIDTLWIRIIWVILIFGFGTGILLYILLWILIPEAKTTAEKIIMIGKPVNISNIEKKIKDGFENVSDTVSDVAKNVTNAAKKVDLQKQGDRIKSSSRSFFDTISKIFMFFVKTLAKCIGVMLIFIGASTLISLIIAFLSLGAVDVIHIPGIDLIDIVNTANTPVWLIYLFVFFTLAIPFFFVFYLGLKILINNLKSIGNIAKFTLLGIWLISIIGLAVVGIRQASEEAYDENIVERHVLNITSKDTVNLKMVASDVFKNINRHNNSFKLIYDDFGNKTIYSSDISIIVKSTTDSLANLSINKSADGSNYQLAIKRAKNINYNHILKDSELLLDAYFTTAPENKFNDQEIILTLYLPEGTIIKCNQNTASYFYHYSKSIIKSSNTSHYLKILENDIECLDCPVKEKKQKDYNKTNADVSKIKTSTTTINNKTVEKKTSEKIKVDINEDGVSIQSKNK